LSRNNFRAEFSLASSKSFRPGPLRELSILLRFHHNTRAPLQIGFRHRIFSTHSLFGSLLFMTQGRHLPKVTEVDVRLRPFSRTRDRSFGSSKTKPICRFLRPGVKCIRFCNHSFSTLASSKLKSLDNSAVFPLSLGFHQSHTASRQDSRFLRPLPTSRLYRLLHIALDFFSQTEGGSSDPLLHLFPISRNSLTQKQLMTTFGYFRNLLCHPLLCEVHLLPKSSDIFGSSLFFARSLVGKSILHI
jgi:hypothetical protein